MLRGIFKIRQLLVTRRICELPRRCCLIDVLRLFCWFSACDEWSWEVEQGDDRSWKGRKLSRAGKRRGEIIPDSSVIFSAFAGKRIPRLL